MQQAAKQTANNLDNQYQKRIYEALKTEYPVFAEYDALLKQCSHATGYYREKFNKQIEYTTKSMIKNKKLMTNLEQVSPKIASQIKKQANQHLQKDLGRYT